MIALVMMGIVLALAMPSYKAFIQNTRIRTAAESILNGLQVARAEAVRHNANVQFILGAASSWTVGCVTATATCPALIQSRVTAEGSSTSIIVTPTPAASTTIVFNNFGALCTLAPCPVPATQLDVTVNPAVLSAAESRPLRMTIGLGGTARMCDPQLPVTDPRAC
jgi:type IV fimbrial biogenesis protein FimT